MNGTLGMGMWVLCKSQVNFGTQSCYGNEHNEQKCKRESLIGLDERQ